MPDRIHQLGGLVEGEQRIRKVGRRALRPESIIVPLVVRLQKDPTPPSGRRPSRRVTSSLDS